MERVDAIGQVATAHTMAKILSATPSAANGPSQFCILDIHALATQFFFGDGVQVRLKSCVPLLVDALLRLPADELDRVVLAFPDEGARKRFGKGRLEAFGEPVVCIKKRDGAARRITVAEGDPRGRHVVLVDDLVQSGGTLREAAKALVAAGAASVSAYCTHAVFPNDAWRAFVGPGVLPPAEEAAVTGGKPVAPGSCLGGGPLFRRFFVADTVPAVTRKLAGVPPFTVLSIAPVLEDILGV